MDSRSTRALRSVQKEESVRLTLDEIDVGLPAPDEVIVQIAAAGLNPSDVKTLLGGATLRGAQRDEVGLTLPLPAGAVRWTRRSQNPRVGGTEAGGIVIDAGSSDAAQQLLGKSVAVASQDGVYSSYVRVAVNAVVSLPAGIAVDAGARAFVNPMTAIALMSLVQEGGHQAFVNDAAGSTLGRMLNRVARHLDIPLVNVVRSRHSEQSLRLEGARWVCNSSSDDFEQQLSAAVEATGASIALDAIGGGDLAGRFLKAMQRKSSLDDEKGPTPETVVYGHLDSTPVVFAQPDSWKWSIRGWRLDDFLTSNSPQRLREYREHIVCELDGIYSGSFAGRIGLDSMLDPAVIARYSNHAGGHKYLVDPRITGVQGDLADAPAS